MEFGPLFSEIGPFQLQKNIDRSHFDKCVFQCPVPGSPPVVLPLTPELTLDHSRRSAHSASPEWVGA